MKETHSLHRVCRASTPSFGLGLKGLMAGLVTSLIAVPLASVAQAQEQFGNNGIQFDTPTIVEFEFAGSDGVYQSVFGVENLSTGERTPLLREERSPNPNQDIGVVANPLTEFEFAANTPYAFYLESIYNGQPAGVLYSINSLNPNNSQQIVFDGGMLGLVEGGTLLQWDDTGSLLVPPSGQDRDFDDFLVQAGGYVACPYSQTTRSESVGTLPHSVEGSADMHLALACTED
ncbi:MAG: DUF4114 domain-containing protein [Elainellaceae cyanobacterium]